MRARRTLDTATLDLFAEPQWTGEEALVALERLSDIGLLRRLDSALAAFIHQQDVRAEPALLVTAAVLAQMEGRGHTCLPLVPLVAQPNDLLAWSSESLPVLHALWSHLPSDLPAWLHILRASDAVRVVGEDEDIGQPLVLLGTSPADVPLLYLRRYWDYERAVGQHIAQRTSTDAVAAVNVDDAKRWLDAFFPAPATASRMDWQKLACALALRGKLSVITGGPGTGKTYTAARLLALLFATSAQPDQLRVALAAPTGKAAARLKQSIDNALLELAGSVQGTLDLPALVQRMGGARTLHSLLGARPDTRHWRHHAGNPLDVDVLIVDEASMIHLEMMSALLQALPPHARLILLGDKDQLASVEAGAVLGDLCRYAQQGCYLPDTAAYAQRTTGQSIETQYLAQPPVMPLTQHTVMLRESRRFDGVIGQLAQAVNSGDAAGAHQLLQQQTAQGTEAELWAHQGGAAQRISRMAVHGRGAWPGYAAYAQLLKERHDTEDAHLQWVQRVLKAFDRFRLLCAVREGEWGVSGLNKAVEQELSRAGLLRTEGEWYVGRPVMVTRNDSNLGVFNGDIGITLPSFADSTRRRVYFLQGDALHHVSTARLVQVETAFAMTVHKSQGSEFEHTALVLSAHGGSVLGRELVYTGITRARKAFTLFTEVPGLLASAIGSPTQRNSGLLRFLEQSVR